LKVKFPLISTSVDYIIVGQGLAGSCLALRLLQRQCRVVVLDVPQSNHSSVIAAGLFNPITGKLMTRSWQADSLFPVLHDFYCAAEQLLKRKFYYRQSIYRPFLSAEEQNDWMIKSTQRGLSDYVKNIYTGSRYGSQVHDPFGGIEIDQCGYIDTQIFLESVRTLLVSKSVFVNEKFNQHRLQIKKDEVVYDQWSARKIIYCSGIAYNNEIIARPLPLRPLKGQTLVIEMEEKPERIYNRGVYLVPMAERNRYKVGATYEPNDSSKVITTSARLDLENKLKELIKMPFRVILQEWGIRPATSDRRPLLGPVAESENVIIFNGLGTKGVSLAPYFSEQLADWLTGAGEIQPEVNISRFNALSSKSSEVV
jgi:glycine oxidase